MQKKSLRKINVKMVKKVHITKRYKRIRVKSPSYFDKRSLRTIDPGRRGFLKIIIGCKKGKYNSKTKRCRIGTQAQSFILNKKDFAREGVDIK